MTGLPLEKVITEARGEAAVYRKHGDVERAKVIEVLIEAIVESAPDYLTWLSEDEAKLKSGHDRPWFRHRFPTWEAQGLAKKEGRRRMYRSIIVPQRANIEAARAAARRALGRAT